MEPLLLRINTHDNKMLIDNAIHMEVKKGGYIFKEGDPATNLYFILKGEVRVYKDMGNNKEITIFTRGENDSFGEIGIFSGRNYSNTAQATKDCVLYHIEKGKLETIIQQNGMLGLHFTRWVAESLEASQAKMRDFLAFGSEGAVASVFVRYSNMYGVVTPSGIKIKEPIMIQDISKHIGISRETVSRIVNKWKSQDILENNNKYFFVKDIDYFKRLLVCEKCGVEHCVL